MKKIILILGLFMFSGCAINYEMVISDDKILETIDIKTENLEESKSLENDEFPVAAYFSQSEAGDYPVKEPGREYYTLNNNYYASGALKLLKRTLTYEFPLDKFADANSIKSCYEDFNFNIKNKEVTMSTSNHFLCIDNFPAINEVNIVITVNYPVLTHNADAVKDNKYYWKIDKTNYLNRSLILSFQTKEQKENKKEKPNTMYMLVLVGIFFIVIISIFVYKLRHQNQ